MIGKNCKQTYVEELLIEKHVLSVELQDIYIPKKNVGDTYCNGCRASLF